MLLNCVSRRDYAPVATEKAQTLFIVSRQRLEQTRREIYDFVEFKFRQLLEEPLHAPFVCLGRNGSVSPRRPVQQSCPASPGGHGFVHKTREAAPALKEPLVIKKRQLTDSSSQRVLRFSPPKAEAAAGALPESTLASRASSTRESASKQLAFEFFEPPRLGTVVESLKKKPAEESSKEALISSLDDFLSLQHIDGALLEAPLKSGGTDAPGPAAFRRKERTDSLSSSEGELLTDKERALRLNRRLSRREASGEAWERRESLLRQTGLAFSFTKSRALPANRHYRGQPPSNPFAE